MLKTPEIYKHALPGTAKPGYHPSFSLSKRILWILVCLMIFLSACAGQNQVVDTSILDEKIEPADFDQIKADIDQLYKDHPDIESYVVKNVYYTQETRDKVLKVCSMGGTTSTTQSELETQKVLACAPLIFFFYNYGQEKSVQASIDISRQLYWFAITDNPSISDSGKALTSTLQGWGIK